MIKCSAEKKSNFSFSDFFVGLALIFCDRMLEFSLKPHFSVSRDKKWRKNYRNDILIFFSHYKFDIETGNNKAWGSRESDRYSKCCTTLKGDPKILERCIMEFSINLD